VCTVTIAYLELVGLMNLTFIRMMSNCLRWFLWCKKSSVEAYNIWHLRRTKFMILQIRWTEEWDEHILFIGCVSKYGAERFNAASGGGAEMFSAVMSSVKLSRAETCGEGSWPNPLLGKLTTLPRPYNRQERGTPPHFDPGLSKTWRDRRVRRDR